MLNRARNWDCSRGAYALGGLAVLATLGWVEPADACSCSPPPPPQAALEDSGSVFEGRVVSLNHEPESHRITAKLEVLRRWKGSRAKTIDAVTIDQGSMCGFSFELNESYLVYASERSGPVSVSLCSRSRASVDAAEDFDALDRRATGPASRPTITTDPGVETTSPSPGTDSQPPAQPETTGAPSTSAPRGRGGCAGCSTESSRGGALAWLVLVGLAWVACGRARPS